MGKKARNSEVSRPPKHGKRADGQAPGKAGHQFDGEVIANPNKAGVDIEKVNVEKDGGSGGTAKIGARTISEK
jgi:hypothetical protein